MSYVLKYAVGILGIYIGYVININTQINLCNTAHWAVIAVDADSYMDPAPTHSVHYTVEWGAGASTPLECLQMPAAHILTAVCKNLSNTITSPAFSTESEILPNATVK